MEDLSFIHVFFYAYVIFIVPVAPPGNVKAENVSSSVLLIEWSHIIEEKRRGILLGYRIYFHEVGSGNETNVTVSASTTSTEITGLKRLTNYSISVVGFTIKGEGVSSNRVIGTTELASKILSNILCVDFWCFS